MDPLHGGEGKGNANPLPSTKGHYTGYFTCDYTFYSLPCLQVSRVTLTPKLILVTRWSKFKPRFTSKISPVQLPYCLGQL